MNRMALILATTLLVGCSGLMPASFKRGTSLVLTPRIIEGSYQTQATVSIYTGASIDHLVLKIFQGGTELASKTITKPYLSNPITFTNLRANTPYRIKSFAYLASETLISHDDASSWLDIMTGTDDRPTINALPVHLIDIPFNGQGTASIQVTNGGYILGAPENLAYLGISTIVGNGSISYSASDEGALATEVSIYHPCDASYDLSGNLYFVDTSHHRVRKVSPNGTITTVAGDGVATFSVDGIQAASASLNIPTDVTVDASGILYIADYYDHRVRKVSADGVITTVAGNGTAGFSGDGGQAIAANLNYPYRIALDASGNLYISDSSNYRIRKVAPNGIITTIAGNEATGFSGDGGQATNASLGLPTGVALDTSGNLYISDADSHRIRKVATSGIITTIAGDGTDGNSGDGGPATSAQLRKPYGLTVDTDGTLFFADLGDHRVKKISNGIITTVAGNGTAGFNGDGEVATTVNLYSPAGVTFNAHGDLIITDFTNNRIRKMVQP